MMHGNTTVYFLVFFFWHENNICYKQIAVEFCIIIHQTAV